MVAANSKNAETARAILSPTNSGVGVVLEGETPFDKKKPFLCFAL